MSALFSLLTPKGNFFPLCSIIGAIIIVTGTFIYSLIVPPILNMDTYDGFSAMHAYQYYNAPFNHYLSVDPNDISRCYYKFLGWFTPGQYVLPWALNFLTGWTIGTCSVVVCYLSWISGMVGFSVLFRALGIPKTSLCLSLLVMSVQYFTLMPFYTFDSADILLFGYLPWVMNFFLTKRSLLVEMVSIVLLGLFGFFLKMSFLLLFIPLPFLPEIYRCINEHRDKKNFLFRTSAKAIALTALYLACYFLFLEKGEDVSELRFFEVYWSDILFPITASFFSSAFSLDNTLDILYGDFMHTKHLGFKVSPTLFPAYSMFLLITLVVVSALFKNITRRRYLFYSLSYASALIPFFCFFYFFNTGVDNTTRLYFFSGFLMLPALLDFFGRHKTTMVIFGTFALINAAIHINYLISFKQRCRAGEYIAGSHGFCYNYLEGDQQVIPLLKKMDKEYAGQSVLFIIPMMGLALEMQYSRYLVVHEMFDLNMQFDYWIGNLHGRTEQLFLLTNKRYEHQTIPIILSRLKDYHCAGEVAATHRFRMYELE